MCASYHSRKQRTELRVLYSAVKKLQHSQETGKQVELGVNVLSELSQIQREKDIVSLIRGL